MGQSWCNAESGRYSGYLAQENVECSSDDVWLGYHCHVFYCADACGARSGCEYFIYDNDPDSPKFQKCYWEKTRRQFRNGAFTYCPQGWESDSYDFYVLQDRGKYYSRNKYGSIDIIIPVVIAAVLLVAAVLFLVRKRAVAARQPHRDASMPNVGDEAEAEVEA